MTNELEVVDVEGINDKKVSDELVGSEAEEAGKLLLKKQGESIKRMIKHAGLSVAKVSEKLSISRQLVYKWQWGEQLITESRLEQLARLLERDPIEVRYGITLFHKKDLFFVVCEVEKHLEFLGLYLNPEKKAYLVSTIFEEFQGLKNSFGDNSAKRDFKKKLSDSIDMLKMAMS